MRIGFFTDTYTPQINGVVTAIRLFARALEQQGHSVYIFAPTPRQPADGPHVVRIPSIPFAFQPEMRLAAIYSAHAHRLVRRANLDVIHSHDPFAVGLFGLAMAKQFRIPYVHTYHTLFPEYVHYVWETQLTRELAERLSREFCDRCDTVIAPSTKISKALMEWGVHKPVVTLPTGVDFAKFGTVEPGEADAFRKRFAIPQEARLLTFVGRLGLEKNIDLLIEAIAKVKTPNTRLLIVGDGPHREQLENRVSKMRLRERVHFTGYLDRQGVCAAYHASEALFFASTTETQGLVIAEAMAAGLPVIAVNDLAIADAVADGVNGLLVDGKASALAAAADTVLGSEQKRSAMSEASRLRAEDLSIEGQAARLAEIYSELVALKPSAARRVPRPRMRRRVLKGLTSLSRRGNRLLRRSERG